MQQKETTPTLRVVSADARERTDSRRCESYQDKSGPCPIGKGIQSTNFEFN